MRVLIIFIFLLSCSLNSKNKNLVTGSHLIGGDYEMTNHHGELVSNEKYKGKYQLLFFGFTRCQTVCPIGLSTIGRTLHRLPKDVRNKIQPLFITVDPERDTTEVISKYLKLFSNQLVGLRGSEEQTVKMVKTFRGYYGKIPDEEGEYTIEHSDIIYFMGKDGEYLTHFSSATKVKEIVNKIKQIVNKNDSN